MEGVEENVDSNISIEDDNCIVDTFLVKIPYKIVKIKFLFLLIYNSVLIKYNKIITIRFRKIYKTAIYQIN